MCGIVGFMGLRSKYPETPLEIAKTMADGISHRGPDDAGTWADAESQVVLAHRRLAILDLSAAGAQPMVSASGRYAIVFNGEIYNHLEIRKRLTGASWRGNSDTETLLAGIEEWGLEKTLAEAAGMFALAVWDRRNRQLLLARDRMGEKPLYFGWQKGVFMFASELKALRRHPSFEGEIDRTSLDLMLRYGYIPAPFSIYKGIHKLAPGAVLRIPSTLATGPIPEPRPYWSLSETFHDGLSRSFRGSEEEAVRELGKLLSEVIRDQMIADVPLGAFLSGGIDSSTVVALMQAQASSPVKTYTIGFEEKGFNEAEFAKAVAKHLGTEHTEIYLNHSQARDIIPILPEIYDEPFADSSAIPTYLVSRLARRHVKVSLSGDGGDELFGGYNRYFREPQRWRSVRRYPLAIRRPLVGIAARSIGGLERLALMEGTAVPRRNLGSWTAKLSNRILAYVGSLAAPDFEAFSRARLSQWPHWKTIVKNGPESEPDFWPDGVPGLSAEEGMMLRDAGTFLPDSVLCKVDRAAMAVSLETRAPLLDHRIVAFSASLPLHLKIRDNRGKWILRKLLGRYVPARLIERPKMGFGVPIGEWLRGPLREWGESLLSTSRLEQQGFLHVRAVRERWLQHQNGVQDWEQSVWAILSFQAWLETAAKTDFMAEADGDGVPSRSVLMEN